MAWNRGTEKGDSDLFLKAFNIDKTGIWNLLVEEKVVVGNSELVWVCETQLDRGIPVS